MYCQLQCGYYGDRGTTNQGQTHVVGCSMVAKSKHKLKDHVKSHTQEKVVACPTCGSLFSNTTKFFDHIKRQTDTEGRSMLLCSQLSMYVSAYYRPVSPGYLNVIDSVVVYNTRQPVFNEVVV